MWKMFKGIFFQIDTKIQIDLNAYFQFQLTDEANVSFLSKHFCDWFSAHFEFLHI